MQDKSNFDDHVNGTQRVTELEKYMSLISTLKGQEEFLLDENGIIISTNLEAVNITGYEEFEVIGEHFKLFYSSEEKEKAQEDLQNAIVLGQNIISGFRVKKRGSSFWAKIKIKHLTDHSSRAAFKVSLQDATHRALSDLRVQTVREEYLTIFNNPFVGSFKFRLNDFRLLMWNKKAEEITGRSDASDIFFNQLFANQTDFDQFLNQLKTEKKVEGQKFRIENNNRSGESWVMISARHFGPQGFAEGILLDITEQHNQMIELQRVNAELDNFTYHASHDLRAPLTTILGLVNLGMMEKEANNVQAYLEMIRGRISHMDVLLKDLISVSYNNKKEISNEPFLFQEEVKDIIKDYDTQGSRCRAYVEVIQEEEFVTDGIRMRTILRNLISNAFKYYNPELESPFVKIQVCVEKRRAAIQLIDNGIGIEWSHKERVYDMFYRATSRSTGTGLGLYIVKSMIDKLNGHISLESTFGYGTTLGVYLINQTKRKAKFCVQPD